MKSIRQVLAAAACLAALSLCVAFAVHSRPARAGDPSALWHVVHDLCVTDMRASGLPAPCAKVDLAGGYAVLKDIRGRTQLLLIPTARVSGIDSPLILAANSPNYWRAAWEAVAIFEKRARRDVPRDDIALAINSIYGRSQDQLHIHIDCVRREVRDTLRANLAGIGPRWARLDVNLAGQRYRAMRLDGPDLGARDPFKLLARGDPAARADMGLETLAVVGATFEGKTPGYILLAGRADPAGRDLGSGEDLLDHDCAVLAR